jgi:hypothetical protein
MTKILSVWYMCRASVRPGIQSSLVDGMKSGRKLRKRMAGQRFEGLKKDALGR